MSRNLLQTLLNAAEKAGNIAKLCRSNGVLLELLIEEKKSDEANPRFVKDFKTLADVLIQETVRHDVGKVFPELRDNIQGEETPVFTNSLGNSVCVAVGDTPDKTAACLQVVLENNTLAAEILAAAVHEDVFYSDEGVPIPDLPADLDYSKIGVWIDPIDATAEYIAGETIFSKFPTITSTGLDCVTVLIGAFNKETGVPILGIINQPFHTQIDLYTYTSKVFWGLSIENASVNNLPKECPERQNKIALFSSSEFEQVINLIKTLSYDVAFSAGAGHKALKVITSEADLYILTKPTTFKWDTCAPQAILQSMGGGLFDFKKSLKEEQLVAISYEDGVDKCNFGGVIAVRNVDLFKDLLAVLSD